MLKNRRMTGWIVAACAGLLLPAGAARAEVEHPRLFVTEQKLAKIRQATQQDGSHHQMAYQAMKQRVDQEDPTAYESNPNKYARSYMAREAALMSLLAGSEQERKKYADLAFETIKDIYEEKAQQRYPHKGYGLSRAMMSLGIGIPYDWCYDTWTSEQREYVKGKIDQALDAWPSYGHANFADQRASNWVGVCRGGELVLMLAAGEEDQRRKRYDKLIYELTQHIVNGFGSLGVSQEGVGYIEYPGGFLLPAVYATADIGDNSLLSHARRRDWWKLAMYAHSFQPHERKFVQTGVAHGSNFDEGWISLLLNLAPEDHLPHYTYFYDRHMGTRAPGGLQDKFDSDRAGTVWAIIYYPTDVEPKDPTGVYPAGVADDRGYYFFRNRWTDENDIQTTVMADTVHHGHAWDQPEVFALNLLAMNTRFIGGPGKSREDKLYSTLLVDGKYNIDQSVRYTGKKGTFEADQNEAYVIVDGGKLYDQLGLDSAKRHYLVRFAPNDNAAILSTLDRVRSDGEHTYTWQANLGTEENDGDVEISTGSESGRPTFVLRGRNGWTKGWVVAPADAKLDADGDPLRISTSADDADIWVVLGVGSTDEMPTAAISGEGMDSTVKLGARTLRYNEAKGRLTCD
ncbi:MAG: hypothetical protein ACOC93_00180 [Planctomycetota bacterium]